MRNNLFNLKSKNYNKILFASGNDADDFAYEEDEVEKGTALETYGTDLTLLAQQGQLEECFGREQELLEMMEILVRRQKNNPVLVGDAGVGKTAIIELFATRIANKLVPFVLEGRTLISLDLARIVAGSRYRGEFELRFQKVISEVFAQPNIIVFIDEIHNIGGAGTAEGSMDAANILKPALSRSGFQCIGATTTKEYQRIEKDPALNRRFQPVQVKEPSIDDTIKILYGLRPSLEAFHNVEILPSAIKLAVTLASRYIYDRFLPDKAIDLIDRAAAKKVIQLTNITEGSVVSSIINASLKNVGILRMEAFRRGDTATEFVFQEIENAYRNFLLRWIETPLTFNKEQISTLSPISTQLVNMMKTSILNHIDDLLFSSSKLRTRTLFVKKAQDLSIIKNQHIYTLVAKSSKRILSLYRISLFVFVSWLNLLKNPSIAVSSSKRHSSIVNCLQKDMLPFLRIKRINTKLSIYNTAQDFLAEDTETIEKNFEILSELEETRIDVVKHFLTQFKPILRKGVIESLKYSSELSLTEQEIKTIYNLLGYFSTNAGNELLFNLDDPSLVKQARKLGNFSGLKKQITPEDIRELLSSITGIPIKSLSGAESNKLIHLETLLHKQIIGQEEAVSAIAKAIRRSRLGIQNPHRPIASFLFCGPTGVGKTEVTKVLASSLFGSESDMIRFDMSEFMEKFTLSRLIGSPPGYIGYDEGGQLTDAVRKKPYSVILFDEIEKAHPDILNILLQILEDGRLTDSQKRLVPFENTVIIMTSNAAAEEIQQIIKEERKKVELPSLPAKVAQKSEEYTDTIQFLESPITENFLNDIKKELKLEFDKSVTVFKNKTLHLC